MQITVKFGMGNEITREFPEGATVGVVLADPHVKAGLGFGTNVQGLVDGVPQGEGSPLEDGDVITVETKVGTKA